jgi:AraC family transcriptional regulator
MARPDRRRVVEPGFGLRDPQLFQIALLLKAEAEGEDPSDPLFVDSLAIALAARLLGQYGDDGSLPLGAKLSKPKLRLALDYIEGNLDGDIRLATLADLMKLSPSHFRLLFRQTTQRPVHQYLIERRVQRAKTLIESGNVSISQAALASGFCHQSHLARRMRQVLGLTPSQVAPRKSAGVSWRTS